MQKPSKGRVVFWYMGATMRRHDNETCVGFVNKVHADGMTVDIVCWDEDGQQFTPRKVPDADTYKVLAQGGAMPEVGWWDFPPRV